MTRALTGMAARPASALTGGGGATFPYAVVSPHSNWYVVSCPFGFTVPVRTASVGVTTVGAAVVTTGSVATTLSLPRSGSTKSSAATLRSFTIAWSLKRPASAETAAKPYGLVWLVDADGEKNPARMMK